MNTILIITIAIVVVVYAAIWYINRKRPDFTEKESSGDNHVFDDV